MTNSTPRQRFAAMHLLRKRMGPHYWTNAQHVGLGAPRGRMKVDEWILSLTGEEVSALIARVKKMPIREGEPK